eukprot:g18368.t1
MNGLDYVALHTDRPSESPWPFRLLIALLGACLTVASSLLAHRCMHTESAAPVLSTGTSQQFRPALHAQPTAPGKGLGSDRVNFAKRTNSDVFGAVSTKSDGGVSRWVAVLGGGGSGVASARLVLDAGRNQATVLARATALCPGMAPRRRTQDYGVGDAIARHQTGCSFPVAAESVRFADPACPPHKAFDPSNIVGIGGSGGGLRAVASQLGAFKALMQIEPNFFANEIDIYPTISGGSQLASQFLYAPGSISEEQLLGTLYPPPEDLTMEVLQSKALSGLVGANSNDCNALPNVALPPDQYGIGITIRCFLARLGLANALMLEQTVDNAERLLAAAQQVGSPLNDTSLWLSTRCNRPRDHVVLASLLAPVNHASGQDQIRPFGFSPQWSGSPYFATPDGLQTYQPNGAPLAKPVTLSVGGGLVESFAFGGERPAGPIQEGVNSMPAPTQPLSLAFAVASSSNAAGVRPQQSFFSEVINPQAQYWAISNDSESKTSTFRFGDGGNLENEGVIYLLQRGASKIMNLANRDIQIIDKDQVNLCADSTWENETYVREQNAMSGKRWASEYHLSCVCRMPCQACVGRLSTTCPVCAKCHNAMSGKRWASEYHLSFFGLDPKYHGEYLAYNQIFPYEELRPWLCKCQTLKEAGRPILFQRNMPIVPNSFWNIKGGNVVSFLWYYLDTAKNFEAQLPAETREQIVPIGGDGAFPGFPIYKLTNTNSCPTCVYQLNTDQTNLLAAQSQWAFQLKSSQVTIEKWLRGSGGKDGKDGRDAKDHHDGKHDNYEHSYKSDSKMAKFGMHEHATRHGSL